MAEFIYNVIEDLGCLNAEETDSGWNPYVKIIAYGNNGKAKLDIRQWNMDYRPIKMGKGISLNYEQAEALKDILEEFLETHDKL